MLAHPANEIDSIPLGELLDAMAEMPEPGEEVYSSPEKWPDQWDDDIVALGAALMAQEIWGDPLPDDDDLEPF